MSKKKDRDVANCGEHLVYHTPHWFYIKNHKLWCPGKPWLGGGD